jgi:hypothetical protein
MPAAVAALPARPFVSCLLCAGLSCACSTPGTWSLPITTPCAPAASPPRALQEAGTRGEHARGQFRALFGARKLGDSFFESVREQAVLGIEGTLRLPDSDFAPEVALTLGYGMAGGFLEDVEESTSCDLTVGGRYTFFGKEWVRPYVGAGIGVMYVDVDLDNDDVSGSDNGFSMLGYVRGGVDFSISESLLFGVDARAAVGTDVELLGTDARPDYFMVAITLSSPF